MGKILSIETKNKFGYDIDNLKPSSCKLVIWECDKCGIKSEKKYRAAKRINLCLQCSNKINANINVDIRNNKLVEWHKNHEHPLKGTKRPEYVVEAIKNAHIGVPLSDEHKRKLSEKNSGENNPFYGKKHTEKSIEKMKLIQKKIARKGKDSNFYGISHHGRGQWYLSKEENKIWMRSSWEIKFAEYLDRNNIKWNYELKTFPINDKETYTPDFYLIDEKLYIEVKGYWREDAKIKYQLFKEIYKDLKIEIYDINKLKELKIL